jgi:hypothetical protein
MMEGAANSRRYEWGLVLRRNDARNSGVMTAVAFRAPSPGTLREGRA